MSKTVRVPVQISPDRSYAISDRIYTADLGIDRASKNAAITAEWHLSEDAPSYADVSAVKENP